MTSQTPPTADAAPRRVARNAIARILGEVVAKLASIAFVVALARELGQTGFGDFMFALSLTTLLVIISGFGTEELLAREVARDRSRVHGFLSNVVAIKAPTSAALVLVALLVVVAKGASSEVLLATALIGTGVALENLGRSWNAVFQAFERMDLVAVALIAQRASTAGAGIALLMNGAGLLAAAAVFLGGALVGFAINVATLRRFVIVPRWKLDLTRLGPIAKAGVPIGMLTLLFTVLLKADQTLLGLLADNREVGFYAAAMRLVEATMFIACGFSAAILPWFAAESEDSTQLARAYGLGLKVMMAVLLPIGLGFALLAEPLVDVLYGQRYEAAIVPLRYLGVMTALYGVSQFAVIVMVARDRPGDFSRLLAGTAVFNILLNVALIPPYGAAGAAFAALASSLLLAAMSIWRVSKAVGSISVTRSFLVPVLGGAAMAATLLLLPVPALVGAPLGAIVYLGVVITLERLFYQDDLALVAGALPGKLGAVARGALGASHVRPRPLGER